MKLAKINIMVILFWYFSLLGLSYASQDIQVKNTKPILIDLFISSTCPYCEKAKLFLTELQREKPWIQVETHIINEDKSALDDFYKLLQKENSNNFTVPSMFFCDSHWMGFDKPETTGKILTKALEYCHNELAKKDSLSKQNIETLKQWANATWFEGGISNPPRPLLFIPLMSLFDAFNPCSMFGLMGLFAFVVLTKQRKIQWIGGGLIILMLSVLHYLSQAHSAFFYQIWGYSRFPAALVGLTLLGFIYLCYYKRRSCSSLFLISLLALSLFFVQIYQQNCNLNFSLVFEQWLLTNDFSWQRIKLYQFTYNFIYFFALSLFLAIFILLTKIKRLKRFNPMFVLVSLGSLILIGLFLIIYPHAFTSLILSLALLILIVITAYFIDKKNLLRLPYE